MAYQFTNPIRYYKANDPYYYEVDNLPLRQLEENILYLKDVVAGDSNLGGVLTANSELDLKNIKQLRPTLLGTRGIKVNAGWFNARINDAYSTSDPLLNLLNISPPQGGGPHIISDIHQAWTPAQKEAVWTAFTTEGDSPYNMNGLEIAYTFHQSPGGVGGNWGVTVDKNPRATGEGSEAYPKYESANRLRWPLQTSCRLTPADLATTFGINLLGNAAYNYDNLQDIHLAFVKVWRSPFRTAVVDFPESVIQIPPFNKYDYYYYGEDGLPVDLSDDADQRIDLLVAYSVPIDSSGATLTDYSDSWCVKGADPSVKTITSPQLGLIRGAGIGLRKDSNIQGEVLSLGTTEGCDISAKLGGITPGDPKILANINDTQVTANQGLTDKNKVKVHGSFPSPDDLINMAPLLALGSTGDELSNEDRFQLIGQTALPLAYIVVTKNQDALTTADILDIRPFMRTTELSYNERAGVAGANPPLSLANPAVGAYQLQNVIDDLDFPTGGEGSLDGKIIYADYIQGGLAYGVEGTLLTMCDQTRQASDDPFGALTTNTTNYVDANSNSHDFSTLNSSKAFLDSASANLRKALLEYFYRVRQSDLKKWLSSPGQSFNIGHYLGFPSERNISLFPEWDIPMDGTTFNKVMSNPATKSAEATWWMWLEGVTSDRPYSYVPGAVPSNEKNNTAKAFLAKKYQQGYGATTGHADLEYFTITCSKRFEITLPEWCTDYDIMADYSNCVPFTASIADDSTNGAGGLSINKGPVMSINGQNKAVFTIIATSTPLPAYGQGMIQDGRIMDQFDTGSGQDSKIAQRLYQWLSYSVVTPQNEQTRWGTSLQADGKNNLRKVPKIGAAYYPTVGFKVVGFEKNPIFNNLRGSSTLAQTGTYIPSVTNGSSHDNITGTFAPVYARSKIDISES